MRYIKQHPLNSGGKMFPKYLLCVIDFTINEVRFHKGKRYDLYKVNGESEVYYFVGDKQIYQITPNDFGLRKDDIIFTTDKSIEEYNKRKITQQFDL